MSTGTTSAPTLRLAQPGDVETLNRMIRESARALSVGFYTPAQTEAAIRWVFGVDSVLVNDGTYFIAEWNGDIAGCGGWSRRRTLYGGDQRPVGGDDFLDPATDAAKVRAFFVAPAFARRGVGTILLESCADAAWHAGFRALELMATLPGVPLYAARGFTPVEDVHDTLPDGTILPFVRMRRALAEAPRGRWRAAERLDAASIARLHAASWGTAYRGLLPDDFLDTLDVGARTSRWEEVIAGDEMRVLVREVTGAGLVAFCAVGASRDDDAVAGVWEIHNLHADPGVRGRGYGGELFDEAMRLASRAGATQLTLWVAEENAAARAFYARRGMAPDGARQLHVLAPGAELREVRYRMPVVARSDATP